MMDFKSFFLIIISYVITFIVLNTVFERIFKKKKKVNIKDLKRRTIIKFTVFTFIITIIVSVFIESVIMAGTLVVILNSIFCGIFEGHEGSSF